MSKKEVKTVITSVQRSKAEHKISIPQTMSKLEASKELKRQWDDEQTVAEYTCQLNEWHWKDSLYAVHRAAEEVFGWIEGKTTRSFFGTQRPAEIEITVGFEDDGTPITKTCFYGDFNVSAWGDANVNVHPVAITVTVKKMYKEAVQEWFAKIRNNLKEGSIFRGQAARVTWSNRNMFGQPGIELDLFHMKPTHFDKIVLNADTQSIIKNFVLPDIELNGKRCYLFSGPYGTGKTETALRIGALAMKAGLPFFYCKDSQAFQDLLIKAKQFQPCFIFMEDIDEIGSGEERDGKINKLLNTLDGVETKNNAINVILTTNHEKKINKALRRPGRIDLVLKFGNPDETALKGIYEVYLGDLKGSDSLDYDHLARIAPDASGAVQAEICKRAVKLATREGAINTELVEAAINSMKHHLDLMNENIEEGTPRAGKVLIQLDNSQIEMTDSLVYADVKSENN